MKKPNARVLLASSLSMGVLAGCATVPPDPIIANARQTVAQAQADPEAVRYAQPDIARAQQLMYAADQAIRDGYPDLARHDAYLATEIATAAEQTGREHADLDRIADADRERQQIQLDARAREASAARADAQAAQQDAQTAQANAGQTTASSQDLQSELATLNAQQTDRGLVVNFGDELFNPGNASLKPSVSQSLDQLAQVLNAHPERRVLAQAHTDGAGSDNDLSARRASALKDALVQRGVSADRVDVAGPDDQGTVASNNSAGGGQPVRWVEVIISDQSGNVASR
jgi:outer membrane protein OmpA-like peptidoglycan-associated protein